MKTEERVEQYVCFICDILGIFEPEAILYDSPNEQVRFKLDENGLVDPDDYLLCLPSVEKIEAERVFHFLCIAHELRHVYQAQQYINYLEGGIGEVDSYTLNEIQTIGADLNDRKNLIEGGLSPKNTKGYNRRFMEIDANAYGATIMLELFDIGIVRFENDAIDEKDLMETNHLIIERESEVLSQFDDMREEYVICTSIHDYDLEEMRGWLRKETSKYNLH